MRLCNTFTAATHILKHPVKWPYNTRQGGTFTDVCTYQIYRNHMLQVIPSSNLPCTLLFPQVIPIPQERHMYNVQIRLFFLGRAGFEPTCYIAIAYIPIQQQNYYIIHAYKLLLPASTTSLLSYLPNYKSGGHYC